MENSYKRKWDDVTEKDVWGALSVLKHCHNPKAARSLVEFFYERFDDGDGNLKDAVTDAMLDAMLHTYVHLVLKRIVADGWTPEQAMGFKRRKGRLKENNQGRDIEIAAYVALALRDGDGKTT